MTRLWLWIPRDLLPFSHGYRMDRFHICLPRGICVKFLHYTDVRGSVKFLTTLRVIFWVDSFVVLCLAKIILLQRQYKSVLSQLFWSITKNMQTNPLLLRAERPYTLSSCQKFISLCGIKCFSFKAAVFVWSCFAFLHFSFSCKPIFLSKQDFSVPSLSVTPS